MGGGGIRAAPVVGTDRADAGARLAPADETTAEHPHDGPARVAGLPARACLAHFVFEKIHPFMDGNGRAGRLLMQSVLHQYGYGMKGMLPIEEYLDNNRLAYYRYLEEPYSDVTEYLHFMLEALAETAKKTKKLILLKQQPLPEDILLPRRAEIFRIIKDH